MRKKYFELEKVIKKALPLFKKGNRLFVETGDGFFISEGHFILKATAAAFNDVVKPVYDDFKPCDALKSFTGSPEKSFIYEILGSYKDGKNAFTVLAAGDHYKIIAEKLLKPFISDETVFYEAAADVKTSPEKTPLYIATEGGENIGMILPVNVNGKSLEELKSMISATAEKAEKEKEKIKGLFYSIGPDAIYIKGGRKDEKTINTIISWIADIRKIDLSKVKPEVIAATAEAVKRDAINCTCELVKDPAGDYYRFSDNKNFFHCDPVTYKDIPVWTESGDIMTFKAGYVTAAEKAEAATADGEKAGAKNNMEVENMNEKQNEKNEAVKTETAEGVKVTFKDGTVKEFSAEVAEALKNDPCVDYIGDKPEPVKESEPATAAPSDNSVKESKKPEKEPIKLTPETVNESNYKELAFQLFGGLGKKANPELILLAGISANVITCEQFKEYLFKGRFPKYHTFEAWKDAGYIVKKGEKALFKADIWKYTEKHGKMTAEEAASLNAVMVDESHGPYKEGDETTKSRFIKKLSFFFGPDQVEKIEKKDFTAPEGCELKKDGDKEILTGDTLAHKEAIKAAGFFWDRKNKFWYRAA